MVWALLDTLSRELQALVEHPNGTKTNPATTCKELLLAHPGLPDGTRGMGDPWTGPVSRACERDRQLFETKRG